MEKKLYAIGEALIDFIPQESGRPMKDVLGFCPKVGGAPANVCGAFTRLGGKSEMITQLGDDPFGNKIEEALEENGIGTSHVLRTKEANTSLAFVALKEDGNREFSFYRKPGADMLFSKEKVEADWFKDAYALHFCSVSLGDFPMKKAHKKAIEAATEAGAIISFDPNLRFALWENLEDLKKAVLEFLPLAHVLKLSDEELYFLTGEDSIEAAKEKLFVGNVHLLIYTRGADGAECYTKKANAQSKGKKVKAVDTTGAGDAFIGSFLYQLYADGVTEADLPELTSDKMAVYLDLCEECAESRSYCLVSNHG